MIFKLVFAFGLVLVLAMTKEPQHRDARSNLVSQTAVEVSFLTEFAEIIKNSRRLLDYCLALAGDSEETEEAEELAIQCFRMIFNDDFFWT